MNLVVIANCHVQPLSYLLELSPDINSVTQIPLHLKGTEHYYNPIKKIENSRDRYTVFHFPGALENIEFSQQTLDRFDRKISFTNIYFTGLHPDATYIGGMGKRFLSPIGDYHSRIIYLSFVKNLSINDCLKKFSPETYLNLGYYKQWNISADELFTRDLACDIKFAEDFLQLVTNNLSLLTFNHPTPVIFNALANKMLNFLNLSSLGIPIESQPNFLATNSFWPIYDKLNLENKLNYTTPFLFKAADTFGKKILSLEQFVTESYNMYTKFGVENIEKPFFYESQKDLI